MPQVLKYPLQVGDKVIEAIRVVRTHKGASRVAIAKFLTAEEPDITKAVLAAALKKLVADKKLLQVWASLHLDSFPPSARSPYWWLLWVLGIGFLSGVGLLAAQGALSTAP